MKACEAWMFWTTTTIDPELALTVATQGRPVVAVPSAQLAHACDVEKEELVVIVRV